MGLDRLKGQARLCTDAVLAHLGDWLPGTCRMSIPEGPQGDSARSRLHKASQVIIVSSVMFTFISYWRTAAIVLSDLGSTAYYIGGIVEQAIGPAAPWFILAVMLFSYAVRSVYIESVSLFVRGGVYRVTREALGGLAAKVAVSALLFDYVLTGPISSVAAGQYIMGLLAELSGTQLLPWVRTGGCGSDCRHASRSTSTVRICWGSTNPAARR